PGRAARARPRALQRPGRTCRHERHPGVALVLLQEPHDARGPLPGARPVHPAHEAEEHAAAPGGRGSGYAPGAGLLRVSGAAGPAPGPGAAAASIISRIWFREATDDDSSWPHVLTRVGRGLRMMPRGLRPRALGPRPAV